MWDFLTDLVYPYNFAGAKKTIIWDKLYFKASVPMIYKR